MTGKWLIHLALRGAAESISSLVLQCCREVSSIQGAAGSTLCLAAFSLHGPVSVLSHQVLNQVPQGVKVTISEPLTAVQLMLQFKEMSVHAVSPSQSLRNSAVLWHLWHSRELVSFPSLVSGLSEELLSCTLTSLALLPQRAEVSHQSLGSHYSCTLTRH